MIKNKLLTFGFILGLFVLSTACAPGSMGMDDLLLGNALTGDDLGSTDYDELSGDEIPYYDEAGAIPDNGTGESLDDMSGYDAGTPAGKGSAATEEDDIDGHGADADLFEAGSETASIPAPLPKEEGDECTAEEEGHAVSAQSDEEPTPIREREGRKIFDGQGNKLDQAQQKRDKEILGQGDKFSKGKNGFKSRQEETVPEHSILRCTYDSETDGYFWRQFDFVGIPEDDEAGYEGPGTPSQFKTKDFETDYSIPEDEEDVYQRPFSTSQFKMKDFETESDYDEEDGILFFQGLEYQIRFIDFDNEDEDADDSEGSMEQPVIKKFRP